MLDAIFSTLDKNVFTQDVINKINEEFDRAVTVRVNELLENDTDGISDILEEYKEELSKKYASQINSQFLDLTQEVNEKLDAYARDFCSKNSKKLDAILESAKGKVLLSTYLRANEVLGNSISESLSNFGLVEKDNSNIAKNYDKVCSDLQKLTECYSDLKQKYDVVNGRYNNMLIERTISESCNASTEVQRANFEKCVNDAIDKLPNDVKQHLTVEDIKNICKAYNPQSVSSEINESQNITNESSQDWKRFV